MLRAGLTDLLGALECSRCVLAERWARFDTEVAEMLPEARQVLLPGPVSISAPGGRLVVIEMPWGQWAGPLEVLGQAPCSVEGEVRPGGRPGQDKTSSGPRPPRRCGARAWSGPSQDECRASP